MSNPLYSSVISLTLLVIIALLGAGIRVAEATAMWGAAVCSTGISTDSRPTSPDIYTANNCRFSTTFVTVSAASIVGPSVTNFVIDQGTVLAGTSAGIGIEGPTASAAPSKGPLKMSVTRTTFGLDAVLVFIGAIPPKSSITLSGNTFSLSSWNANIGGSFTALYIASSTLSLSGGSQLSINDNTFRAPSATNSVLLRCNTLSLTLADSSLANISGNWLGGVNGPTTGYVNLIYFVFTEVTLSGGSVMRFDNNGISNIESQTLTIVSWSHSTSNFTLQLSDGSVISQSGNSVSNVVTRPDSVVYTILWYYPAGSLDVSLARGSRIIISNNTIANVSLGDGFFAYIHAVYWFGLTDSTINMAQNSSLTLGHNVVSSLTITNGSYIYCVRIKFGGPLHLNVLSSSTVNMDDNAISHSRTNAYIYVAELSSLAMVVTVANHSTLSLSRNLAERTQSGTFTFTASFSVGNALGQSTVLNSVLRMDGNSIVNSTAGSYILAVSTVLTSFLVGLNSTFTANNNIVTGANSTGGYVRCVMFWRSASPPMAITVSNSSQLLTNNNTITNSISVTDAVCVTFFTSGTDLIVSLTSGSLFDVSDNSVLNTAILSYTYCLLMAPLELVIASASRFIVSGNTIANSTAQAPARICYLTLNGTMSRSSLLISNNTILNTDAPDIAVADLRLSQLLMAQGSSITIANNTLAFTEIGSRVAYVGVLSIAPAFTASPLVSLSAGSSITIAGNSAGAATPMQQAYLLNATVGISLSFSQVLVHSNSMYARLLGGPALGVVHLSDVVTISGPGSGLSFTENNISVDGECQPVVRIPSVTAVDGGSLNISKNYVSLNATSAECAFIVFGSLSSGRLIVTANTITSTVPLVTLRATSLAIAAGGSMLISSNVAEFTSNVSSGLMAPGSLSMGPMAGLMFYNNTVLGPGGPFLIVNASSAPSLGPGSSVAICGNTVFEDLSSSLMPGRYIAPPLLLRVIVGCRTVSSSVSRSLRSSPSASTPSSSISLGIASSISATGQFFQSSTVLPSRSNGTGNGSETLRSSDTMSMVAPLTATKSTLDTTTITAQPIHLTNVTKFPVKVGRSRTKTSFSISTTKHQAPHNPPQPFTHSPMMVVAVEVPPILPVAVPPATTATLSVISSSLGGVTAAVDAQVVAAVGLVSCAEPGGDESDSLRGLSVAALDNTCEGVLLGNTVALASGAFLSAVVVAVVRLMQVRRYSRAAVGPAPTFVSACAAARAPQILLTACAYFMNSYALCGLRVGGVGLVAFVFALAVVVSFPLLTWLFGARRLMRVRYNWEARALGHVGSFVFQSWVLDPSIDSHKLLGSVFGPYRRLSFPWALAAHMSFIAGLPMMLATSSSGTCGPLFAVSCAVYFLFALIVVVARPRRTTLADVLQACMLLANGLVLADATAVMYAKSRRNEGSLMEGLGTAITVLTVLRLVHSASGTALAILARRGVVDGVEVIDNSKKSGIDGLTDALLDAKHGHHASRNSTWSIVRMPITIFESDGLLWKLPPAELAADTYTIPLIEAFPAPTREEVVLVSEAPTTEEHPRPIKEPPSNKSVRSAAARVWDSIIPSEKVPQFLTEDEMHRRELAKDYGRRQIEELLLL